MTASLTFGRTDAVAMRRVGPAVLCRIALPRDGEPGAEPTLPGRGPLTLAADLRLPGQDDSAALDAVLHAATSGRLPEDLDGDFALALWNAESHTLTLARDRLGLRPLFFARAPEGGIAFASFPDALIEAGVVDGRLVPERVVDLMIHDPPVAAETWIDGVERVLPGHVLTFEAGAPRQRRYWRYPVNRSAAGPDDHDAAARALHGELEAAVTRCLPPGGPLAAHLSGGLDSGAVVALALRLSGLPPAEVAAFCITMHEDHRLLGAIDEEPTARAVADHLGLHLTAVPSEDNGSVLPRLNPALMAPDDPGCADERIVALAAGHGADRILCGTGGDQVVSFTGEGAPLDDLVAFRWGPLRRTARELPGPLWRALARQAALALFGPKVAELLRRTAGRPAQAIPSLDQMLQPAFRRRRSSDHRPVWPHLRQRARLEALSLQHRLESEAWSSARQGLRYVYPLLDWRLLEFAAGLPARLQLHGGLRRALFRTAVSGLLPESIVRRATKLAPMPTAFYEMAENRQALIAELRGLADSSTAARVIDLAALERALAALPPAETVAADMRAAAADGTQSRDARVALLLPFEVARALAQNEADCAARTSTSRRAGTPPRAA